MLKQHLISEHNPIIVIMIRTNIYLRKEAPMKKITEYLSDLDLSIEGTEYEFKVDLNKQDPIKWLKTVVAFSNDLGGKICIGVTNEGYARGFSIEEADKRQIYFNDMVRNKVFPKIDFTITPIETDEKNIILLVDIPVCKSDVVRYKENLQSPERIFRRYPGSTYELISIDEITQYSLQKNEFALLFRLLHIHWGLIRKLFAFY